MNRFDKGIPIYSIDKEQNELVVHLGNLRNFHNEYEKLKEENQKLKNDIKSLKSEIRVHADKSNERYKAIKGQEKIIRELQEKIILLKNAEPMLELTKEYGEKNLYKQRIDKSIKYIKTTKILGLRYGKTMFSMYLNKLLEILEGGNDE